MRFPRLRRSRPKDDSSSESRTPRILWRPDQYEGEAHVAVTATQLDTIVPSASERRRILAEWIDFFETAETKITSLDLRSRVPQGLLDSVAGQRQLRSIEVKWGPYRDITPLRDLPLLNDIRLHGATGLETLEPLRDLQMLRALTVSQPHRVTDVSPLRTLTDLEDLCFGNAHPGSDKSVALPDLTWLRPLKKLKSLWLPGTRLLNPDLSPLLELPSLESLRMPLRRQYRAQVFALAPSNPLFARWAQEYDTFDHGRSATRTE